VRADIPNVFELRGFVRNRRLTALSQYFSMCYFPWVSPAQWADVKTRVLSFFEVRSSELGGMRTNTAAAQPLFLLRGVL
jgi:hypothetical protein